MRRVLRRPLRTLSARLHRANAKLPDRAMRLEVADFTAHPQRWKGTFHQVFRPSSVCVLQSPTLALRLARRGFKLARRTPPRCRNRNHILNARRRHGCLDYCGL